MRFADFGDASASPDVRYLANWVADSRDAAGSGFVIVDKRYAALYVFDSEARMLGSTPVLLGAAPGDDTVAGIGSRPLAEVLPAERTTPAGRFVAERGHNARGEDVVWVDYDAGVSMHRVLTTNPDEHRLERLATPTHEDNRVSYGCINVPTAFYEAYLRPMFASRRAPVYVLPEFKSVEQVFGSYDAVARAAR
ncbi:MAG TPA: L,D-transpeptidase [Burkholderiales bacterium]|nr:L,D-transpeptidase [Burkholderiales bacterium]